MTGNKIKKTIHLRSCVAYKKKLKVSNSTALSKCKNKYNALVSGAFWLSSLIGQLFISARSKPTSFLGDLQRGLNDHEFIPFFQPVIHAKTMKIIGVEVLMRWQHREHGLICPDFFISQAELSGIIIEMTSVMIKDTIKYLNANEYIFQPGFHIAFNITAAHLDNDKILNDCQDFLSMCCFKRWQLTLELTERSMLNDTPDVTKRINKLLSMGVHLSLDDFGTGYSGLTTLQKIRFSSIKIDKSFVSKVEHDENSQHIVSSVIMMAKKMGLTLVAEGVETKEQEIYLCNHGVDFLQGYLYGKPMSPKDFFYYSIAKGYK